MWYRRTDTDYRCVENEIESNYHYANENNSTLDDTWVSFTLLPTEGYPVGNTHQFSNARKIHCSVIVKMP